MAVATLLSAAAVVRVVFGVAVEASRWRALESLVFVATGALGLRMFADKRESGCVVVEFGAGLGNRGMAVRTLGAHGVAMDVVCLVAGKAVRRGIAMLGTDLVAFAAFGFRMFAEQAKVGQLVIEGVFVELHDIRIPTFMVGVTGSTAAIPCVGGQAMKSRPGIHVDGDVLVAIEAQCTLLGALEPRMAGTAVFLVVRMTFDDVTGHDQRFDLGIRLLGYHAQNCHRGSGQ